MSPRPPHRFDPLIHPDIVDNIIPYLLLIDYNPRFLARAALVCKSWNTLYTPFLWRNIKIDNNNFATVPESLQGMMIDLLGKTPQLTSFSIAHNKTDFLVALPMLCPGVRELAIVYCGLIPPSVFSRFFQSLAVGSHNNQPQQQQQRGRASLQLERLHLCECNLEDRSLEHLASSLASTLLHLRILKCSVVTDSGLKAVLQRCHRLESLVLLDVIGLTPAIMTDDTDVNNNNTDLGTTLLTTDQEERQKWACYKTLKHLDIRNLGLQPPEIFLEDSPNRAFRRIRQRIRMLPALEQLAVCVWDADEELLQGFMGVEEKDQGHQARQLTIGENGEGEVVNENANQTDAEVTAAVPIPTTDSVAGGGAESPHHRPHQHNDQEAKTLVGPRLRTLTIWGQQGKTFIGSDLDRFVRNYPGLRELNTSTVVLSKETVDRLREAGIEALSE
ncbi:hypothetical protein KI688_006090 [Linnemannia hyalina]|uniref:F-box domain-containing protein n=1 Tax=Linnemannia hyalina TaxID=64524 RepID=A0A9P8BXZ6_9FUNG|nr:hypothetical protein KI688_006090 [Linnemannia hyalina]